MKQPGTHEYNIGIILLIYHEKIVVSFSNICIEMKLGENQF